MTERDGSLAYDYDEKNQLIITTFSPADERKGKDKVKVKMARMKPRGMIVLNKIAMIPLL